MKKSSRLKKIICLLGLFALFTNAALAGLVVTRSNGMRFTGADGIDFIGTDGVRFTGADGFINTEANGMRFTGADGVRFTGADGIRFTGADGVTYIGANGVRFTGADGIDLTQVDGMRFTGADGIRFTGADGTIYQADSVIVRGADGVSIVGPTGIRFTGADTLRFTGADGTAVAADGLRFTGADTLRFTGADSIVGITGAGVAFSLADTGGVIDGANGVKFTGVDAVLTMIDGVRFTGAAEIKYLGAGEQLPAVTQGLQSVDPELALVLDRATDDSGINALITFHQPPSEADLNNLRQIGIMGGTRFRALPMIYVTATRGQLASVSQLANVRSIYGNRTLKFDSDPFFKATQIHRVPVDRDLQTRNSGLPVTGRNVTVAVLDTGVNGLHPDLSGKVVQNVRLADMQSLPAGFTYPAPLENLPNTDLLGGHGTFVSGVIAASGVNSTGKYNGVAPGANLLGLSAGDLNLTYVLSGFDYILQHAGSYNVRVVNCSFSAEAVFDINDPVNIATRALTDNGISVVFSAGNTGAGNATINPYAVAPWVVSVGATDDKSTLAGFSSRGVFGDPLFAPSLVAPGVNVVSLRALGTQTGTLGLAGADLQRLTPAELPFYTTASGTSFSAPQVSGAIALMLEANPNLTPARIKDILQRSATPLPKYYAHEAGAGMLNTHAAVLEAAFPARAMGVFRQMLENDCVEFATKTEQVSQGEVSQNSVATKDDVLPSDTVQASIYMAWKNAGQNNLGLKVYDPSGNLLGLSDRPNSPGLFGRSEKTTFNFPPAGALRTDVNYTAGGGAAQPFLLAGEITRGIYAEFNDTAELSPQDLPLIRDGLRKHLVDSAAGKFRPASAVTRAQLAATLLRTGKVPQFVSGTPAYSDVLDLTTRSAVEPAQMFQSGSLFYDAANGQFRPDQNATRLVAAVAFVKAAQLDSLAATSSLPANITDANQIPLPLRGYVAVALQKGFITLSGTKFYPNEKLTKLDMTKAALKLIG